MTIAAPCATVLLHGRSSLLQATAPVALCSSSHSRTRIELAGLRPRLSGGTGWQLLISSGVGVANGSTMAFACDHSTRPRRCSGYGCEAGSQLYGRRLRQHDGHLWRQVPSAHTLQVRTAAPPQGSNVWSNLLIPGTPGYSLRNTRRRCCSGLPNTCARLGQGSSTGRSGPAAYPGSYARLEY